MRLELLVLLPPLLFQRLHPLLYLLLLFHPTLLFFLLHLLLFLLILRLPLLLLSPQRLLFFLVEFSALFFNFFDEGHSLFFRDGRGPLGSTFGADLILQQVELVLELLLAALILPRS